MNPTFIDNMSWRMGQVYAAVTDQILINMARHFKLMQEGQEIPGSWQYQTEKLAEMGQVSRETEAIILDMLGGADGALQTVLEDAIRDGLKDTEKQLKTAAERGLLLGRGFLPPEVAPHQMQAFKALYQQSADKLNLVNTVMLESTQQAYAATVSDIVNRMEVTQGILNTETGKVVTGVSSMNQAVSSGVKRMVENGITGYVDHGGHHWSPEAYVTMDIRTTMANAARAAVFERNEAYGNDLYQVSHHNGARPLCYPWQGKVISRDDMPRTVEDFEGNEVHVYAQSETSYGEAAGLFGINCKHYPIPFIPGFSRIRPPEQNEEENAKEYEESQEQRSLERKLREEKRDLEVLKAQGASPDAISEQRDRVRAARSNLDQFCDDTGRSRRSSREGTPIRATWPDGHVPKSTQAALKRAENPKSTQPVKVKSKAASADMVTKTLPTSGIRVKELTKWPEKPTEEKIISSLGGGDRTRGSCSSLAFAYAGNRAGYDVRDFRGGESRSFFARTYNIDQVARFKGVDGTIVSEYSDFTAAHQLWQKVEAGKEYYFGCARHAAIIRKGKSGIEYLELQSAYNNGWHELNDGSLRDRFGAQHSHTIYGIKVQSSSELIEVKKLGRSSDFIEMLRYINTNEKDQKKGYGGHIR